MTQSAHPDFRLHPATPADAALTLNFMRRLGRYQKMEDKITATEDGLRALLASGRGEAVIGRLRGEAVAFAWFWQTASAFIGQGGLYIDGFYVDDSVRHQGLGKVVMAWLAHTALQRGCQRLEWGCLDWNQPAIDFYRGLGATAVEGMTIYRLGLPALRAQAAHLPARTVCHAAPRDSGVARGTGP